MTGLRNRLFSGSLAQLVEQLAFNQLVEGSNPSRPTIFEETLLYLSSVFFCLSKS